MKYLLLLLLAVSSTTTVNLTDGTKGSPYSQQIDTGLSLCHIANHGYALLPQGLSLGTDGTLSGTPTQAGHFKFDVKCASNKHYHVTLKVNPS